MFMPLSHPSILLRTASLLHPGLSYFGFKKVRNANISTKLSSLDLNSWNNHYSRQADPVLTHYLQTPKETKNALLSHFLLNKIAKWIWICLLNLNLSSVISDSVKCCKNAVMIYSRFLCAWIHTIRNTINHIHAPSWGLSCPLLTT